jgi:hypothetical protein
MDSELNSRTTLLRNLQDNFSFAAIKIEAQATEIAKSAIGFVNEKCILGNLLSTRKSGFLY